MKKRMVLKVIIYLAYQSVGGVKGAADVASGQPICKIFTTNIYNITGEYYIVASINS